MSYEENIQRHLRALNKLLEEPSAWTQHLQRSRALLLNLTLYKLTESGQIVPISAAEYYAAAAR
jgi:glutaredoxin 2